MKKLIIIIHMVSALYIHAQSPDTATRDQILTSIADKIKDNYVSPIVAGKIGSALHAAIKSGQYASLSDEQFVRTLIPDLQRTSGDMHFYIKYLPNGGVDQKHINSKAQREEDKVHNSRENFGFETVTRLEGNVGYINFKGFAEARSSALTLESAMNFVANTNSLIIDLRENQGGDNEMVLLFLSYLIEKKTEVYTAYFRNKDKTVISRTKGKVSGKKYLNRPLYFLTSKKTFSAAEALPYIMKHYGNVQIIGEKSGGAANPVDAFLIEKKYLLFIPVGKITAIATGTNWQDTGVIPDQITPVKDAMKAAHIAALKDVQKNKTPTELTADQLQKLINGLER